ncbi:MAG: hypothetical protein ACFFDE_06920, partial [Promethearchaeota archaeon]
GNSVKSSEKTLGLDCACMHSWIGDARAAYFMPILSSECHMPTEEANADINGDNIIDMRDIGIAARNFGKRW